jgi:transcriptional regulator with XRE-family HTH domain
MRFNQTGAAKELGWSQGAISHYLNNITELGPTAIVKFANFLDVDPTEIDPTIVSSCPTLEN